MEKRWLDEINDQEYQKRAQIEADAQDRVAAEEAEKVRQATEAELVRQQQLALTKQVADMSAQLAYYELRGEWNRAVEFGETIHRLDPQNQAILHRLVELYRSRAHVHIVRVTLTVPCSILTRRWS